MSQYDAFRECEMNFLCIYQSYLRNLKGRIGNDQRQDGLSVLNNPSGKIDNANLCVAKEIIVRLLERK